MPVGQMFVMHSQAMSTPTFAGVFIGKQAREILMLERQDLVYKAVAGRSRKGAPRDRPATLGVLSQDFASKRIQLMIRWAAEGVGTGRGAAQRGQASCSILRFLPQASQRISMEWFRAR